MAIINVISANYCTGQHCHLSMDEINTRIPNKTRVPLTQQETDADLIVHNISDLYE